MRARSPWPVTAPALAVLALSGVTGCSVATAARTGTGQPNAARTPGSTAGAKRCGTTRTAAHVLVDIEVAHGAVSCPAALTVERTYAREVASGKVRGNGGGAPVTIRGWVCQGFNTPEVLATGDASACRKAGARIVAVLHLGARTSPSPPSS